MFVIKLFKCLQYVEKLSISRFQHISYEKIEKIENQIFFDVYTDIKKKILKCL